MSDDQSPSKETTDEKSELLTEIQKMIEICEQIPEPYRTSCFEILLKSRMGGTQTLQKPIDQTPVQTPDSTAEPENEFEIPIDVRAFLSQFDLDESVIQKLFLIQNKEIRPKFTIKTVKKSKAQIQIALLLALENAIKNPSNKFEFAAEDVRSRCRDRSVYDQPNFVTHFKNHKKLFKSLTDTEKISLSADGKSELAETISQIING